MYILIGADFVPTDGNRDLFSAGNTAELFGSELTDFLDKADYRIFNLEVPFANVASPIKKNGPGLIAAEDTVNAYKRAGVDLLTLANNHILDQGEKGLFSTLSCLDAAGIGHIGADKDASGAALPFVFDFTGKRVGVYACAEHEFSIVSADRAGANPFDPLESFEHVGKLKESSDYVIVLYHGGKEHYRYPSPLLRKVCRKFVDSGADLVICQHSHCVGCEEKYNAGTIVYGQGNFLFDYRDEECWNTGLLIKIDEELNITYTPIERHGHGVRIASGESSKHILDGFSQRSDEIMQNGFIESEFSKFAKEYSYQYLLAFAGNENFLFKAVNKLTGNYLRKRSLSNKYDEQRLIALRNYIECEAHRELVLEGLTCLSDNSYLNQNV